MMRHTSELQEKKPARDAGSKEAPWRCPRKEATTWECGPDFSDGGLVSAKTSDYWHGDSRNTMECNGRTCLAENTGPHHPDTAQEYPNPKLAARRLIMMGCLGSP